jgi:4-hydroxyphenylacetate 3-monooxygenase
MGAHYLGLNGPQPGLQSGFLNTLGANAEFYDTFAGNARAWHKRGQEAVLYLNHALVNPPIDRNKPVEQVKDVYISIQKETDAGTYVSGAKVVATNSALTHYNFMGQNMGHMVALADRCMADYDEDGWNDPDCRNGDDVSIVGKPL